MKSHFDLRLLFVDMAVAHFRDVVVLVASITLEDVKIRPDLPIYLSPGDPIGLSDKSYEFLEVPGFIDNVLCSDLTVIINIRFGLGTMEDLPLVHREQLVAVSTLVEVVSFLLEK